MDSEHHNKLLDISSALRASAFGANSWDSALSNLTGTLGGVFSTFELIDKRSGQVSEFHASSAPEISLEYLEHFMPRNPRIHHGMRTGAAAIQFDQKFISEVEMDGHEFYSDFLRPFDLRYFLSYKAFETPDIVGAFTLQRSRTCGSVEADELEMIAHLAPVMSIAAESYFNHGKLLTRTQYLDNAVERLSEGVVLLDHRGRIEEMNDAARRIMLQSDGLATSASRLACANGDTNRRLYRVIENLGDPLQLETSANCVVVRRPSGLPAYIIRLHRNPVAPDTLHAKSPQSLIAFVHDPCHDNSRDAQLLCDAFGLTPAEANVAMAIERGQTVSEYAHNNGISLPTVRTQLQKVMQKIDVNRQADVVRVLSSFWATTR